MEFSLATLQTSPDPTKSCPNVPVVLDSTTTAQRMNGNDSVLFFRGHGHVVLPQLHNQREHFLLESFLCHATLLKQHDSSSSLQRAAPASSVIRTIRNMAL